MQWASDSICVHSLVISNKFLYKREHRNDALIPEIDTDHMKNINNIIRVIPCQINTKNPHTLRISLKFDESKAPIKESDHIKFWPHSSIILGFVVT